jgi:hypothetical protein
MKKSFLMERQSEDLIAMQISLAKDFPQNTQVCDF